MVEVAKLYMLSCTFVGSTGTSFTVAFASRFAAILIPVPFFPSPVGFGASTNPSTFNAPGIPLLSPVILSTFRACTRPPLRVVRKPSLSYENCPFRVYVSLPVVGLTIVKKPPPAIAMSVAREVFSNAPWV